MNDKKIKNEVFAESDDSLASVSGGRVLKDGSKYVVGGEINGTMWYLGEGSIGTTDPNEAQRFTSKSKAEKANNQDKRFS